MGVCVSQNTNLSVSTTPQHLDWLSSRYPKISPTPIGEGQFGKVYKAKTRKGETVALKVINKASLTIDGLQQVTYESKILSSLDHPSVLRFLNHSENSRHYVIVTELCEGKDLFDIIKQRYNEERWFSEQEVAALVHQMLKAVAYCHSRGIMHRDIKPENVVVAADGSAKLIDFGLATSSLAPSRKMVGTPYYMAPEVVSGAYTERCDIWSLGVLTYVLLTGYMPFSGGSKDETKMMASKKKLSFPKGCIISDLAKDLVYKMLRKSPALRLSADACLAHPFFAEHLQNSDEHTFAGVSNSWRSSCDKKDSSSVTKASDGAWNS